METVRNRLRSLYQSIVPATIEGRLRWGGILLVMVPSLLFIMVFAVYEISSEREQALNRLVQNVGLRRQMITLWTQNKGVKIKTLAGTENARKLNKAALANDLQASLAVDDKFHNILFVNKEGITEVDLKRPTAGMKFAQTSFFKRALSGQATVAELTVMEASGKTRLVFAAPVMGFDGQFQGVIVGIMPLAAIESIMGSMAFGKTGDTYLVDKQGIRFTIPRFAQEGKAEQTNTACYLKPIDNIAAQNVLTGASGIATYNNYQDTRVFSVYQPIDELGWAIIGEIDENEVLEPVYREIMNMLVIFLSVLLAAIPLTLVVARTIKKPLDYLLTASESIKNRDYSYRVDSRSIVMAPNELKQLCYTFNQMAGTIADHQEHLEDKIKKRTFALQSAIKKLHGQILARRQIELSLLRGEEKYRALFDKATDAIFVSELSGDHSPGRFIEVNNKACELLGYTRQELLDLTLFDIDAKQKIHPTQWNMKNSQSIIVETVHIKKSGETFPVEMNVHQIMLHGVPVYLTIARDISVRRKMEQEMSRLERLNLVGEMAASIGHEVRNPMTTVRGFLQMLGRRSENSPNAEYFTLMIEELDRANGIISEFLSLAKNKPVDRKMCSLNAIVKTLHPLIKADAILTNKEVYINLGDISELYLDEKEIRQLILNLVRNGLEAMSPQTKLVIRTYREGDEVVLAVTDEGPGIVPEILEKLGTPFLTTKEKGTGLGLAVCYSIADRHNATIVPDTSPKGTTFYVRFKTKE